MMKKLFTRSDKIDNESRTDNEKTSTRRIVSILCITGAIALAGLGTACTGSTTDTTTGSVVETETVDSTAAADTENTAETTDTATAADTENTANTDETANSDTTAAAADTTTDLSLEDAKAIALADAGLTEADVTYTAEGQDTDNGVAVYEIDFFTTDTEYDYEIRISDGTVLSKSTEAFIAGTSDTTGITTDSYISVDEAKAIALEKAGLTMSDVTFQKAMLERDDGILIYEIEFYQGQTEHECTINAETGAILEYSTDID